jgi:hypothetical protein
MEEKPIGWRGHVRDVSDVINKKAFKPKFSIRQKIRHTGEGRYPDD